MNILQNTPVTGCCGSCGCQNCVCDCKANGCHCAETNCACGCGADGSQAGKK